MNSIRTRCSIFLLLALLGVPATAAAQRELHWDRVVVDATLDAGGTLRIVETQTMVFTGDWNGGERLFNIRPRQSITFEGLRREDGTGWKELAPDSSLDDVDEYSWMEPRLRWRSRLPSDPPFAGTVLRYEIRYALSGILRKTDEGYLIDHDFLFPDRDGAINEFQLRLHFDPEWQPQSLVRETYSAQQVAAGQGFVLTIPLRFSGTGDPSALDTSRSPAIITALGVLLGVSAVAIVWLFVRELWLGRFAPLPAVENTAWLREHVLAHPAEVIGAAWDDGIGSSEVVALLARLVSEKKLESDVASKSSMALGLKVPRASLEGYERTLVDKLFFNERVKTTTELVKQHYRKTGFNPVDEIRAGVAARLDALLPPARMAIWGFVVGALWLVGTGLLVREWFRGETSTVATVGVWLAGLIFSGIGGGVGGKFRGRLDWGLLAAWLTLLPGLAAVGAASWLLWWYAGLGYMNATPEFVAALTAIALAALLATVGAMRSRQRAEGVAFRRRLTAARAFFARELAQPQPALQDEWFPWMLAFGLGKQMDDWSVQHRSSSSASSRFTPSSSSSTSSGGTGSGGWSGFGGGRSGGGGASTSWASAAGSIAAGVSPPSSSGSSSGGGGGGSSSSGGSSGGGGGGGW